MGIICWILGHKIDEIMSEDRETNVKFMIAHREIGVCKRCKLLVAGEWEPERRGL